MAKADVHWSRAGEAGTLLGMQILLLVYRVFGRWGFRVFLFPVISYFFLTRKEAREASTQYLQKLRPHLAAEQQASLTSFQHFLMFGEILLDKFLVWMGGISREDVVFETPAVFEKVDHERKGGVIIVSHLGNTEVCSALAHQLPDIRLTLLVYTRHAEKFNSLMKKVNSSARIEMLQVTDMSPATAMILSERVEAGEYIVIAGDRTPVTGTGRVSTVSFLGGDAPMPQGAFILAGLLKCPVYLMFCIKQQAQYHISLELFSEQLKFSRKERHQAISKAVQNYANRLEHYCIKAPLQWFNFFPFWCVEPAEKDSKIATERNNQDIS
ncbi:MAG: lipid A biosynthesis acyltransferase [Amphritea sp.]